jgi:hypothetical protein
VTEDIKPHRLVTVKVMSAKEVEPAGGLTSPFGQSQSLLRSDRHELLSSRNR